MEKSTLIRYLDELLDVRNVPDSSRNGLQVESSKDDIRRLGYAVDASSSVFALAAEQKVDALFVHHGLFWGRENLLTGIAYRRMKLLIGNDIMLYACHLPLDMHRTFGNNIGILQAFNRHFRIGNPVIEPFGDNPRLMIGYGERFEQAIAIDEILDFCRTIGIRDDLRNHGKKDSITSLCVSSGGSGHNISAAKECSYDLFITGEAAHYEMMEAKDIGQSVLLGGHYETETFGPTSIAEHLREEFGLEIVFLDSRC